MSLKIMVWALSLKISFSPGLDVDMSLAREHFQKTTAAQAAEAAGSDSEALYRASPYELMLLQLNDDKRRLKGIQSVERKIELKRVLLPNYAPYVDGALSAGKGAQDDILMTVMLWRLDSGDFSGALAIGRYALHYGLVMPDQYKRDVATVLAEEVALGVLSALDHPEQDLSVLQDAVMETQLLTQDRDMPDEVRARLHKALGYCLRERYPHKAIIELKRALELHEKAGVKKDIEQLERELKKAALAPQAES